MLIASEFPVIKICKVDDNFKSTQLLSQESLSLVKTFIISYEL